MDATRPIASLTVQRVLSASMESSTQQDVAAEVRAELARQQRSGASLALQLGWQQKYLSRRMTGQVPFDVNDLAAIASALGVPVTTFFTEGPRFGELPARLPVGVRRPGSFTRWGLAA